MKLIVEDNWQKNHSLLRDTFFEGVASFLTNRKEKPPTLREIKSRFPEVKVDRAIEEYIQLGLIARSDRRYQLIVPVYNALSSNELIEKKVASLKTILAEWSVESRRAWFVLQGQRLKKEPQVYFVEEMMELFYFRELCSDQLIVQELADEPYAKTIPAYFSALREGDASLYEPFAYLGDVNTEYYLDQLAVLFEKARKQSRRIRPTIFLQSLVDFGFLTDTFVLRSVVEMTTQTPIQQASFAKADACVAELTNFEKRRIFVELWHFFEKAPLTIVHQDEWIFLANAES